MAKMITAIIVKGTEPVNVVALSSEDAADWFANYDGTSVVPDPNDDFGTEFVTLKGCKAFDVTDLDPMPGVGNGWKYVKGEWVAPEGSEFIWGEHEAG
jgi:hypothetical protein